MHVSVPGKTSFYTAEETLQPCSSPQYDGIPLYNTRDMAEIKMGETVALITPITGFSAIKRNLMSAGVCQKAIPIWELTDVKSLKERLEGINML